MVMVAMLGGSIMFGLLALFIKVQTGEIKVTRKMVKKFFLGSLAYVGFWVGMSVLISPLTIFLSDIYESSLPGTGRIIFPKIGLTGDIIGLILSGVFFYFGSKRFINFIFRIAKRLDK